MRVLAYPSWGGCGSPSEENRNLKQLVADPSLNNAMVPDVLSKGTEAGLAARTGAEASSVLASDGDEGRARHLCSGKSMVMGGLRLEQFQLEPPQIPLDGVDYQARLAAHPPL